MLLLRFATDSLKEALRGGREYKLWLLALLSVCAVGGLAYLQQLRTGLVVTGMSDQVSWGVYIANFTFLVGVAAAAVMVVIPAYIFDHKGAKTVVLLAEGVAVAACIMCMAFVMVDLGRPDRAWHLIPFIGRFNFPISILAWDVVVLNGYLALNLFIPMYFLYKKWAGEKPNWKKYFPWVVLSIFWAISIHTVTAFLFSWNPARPFWHTALMAPRFIASAFAAGPAFIILVLVVVDRKTDMVVGKEVIRLLATIATVAMQINLFMLGAEIFTEFYAPTQHAASAIYLFKGIGEHNALLPWIYSALALEISALVILMINPLRENMTWLYRACVLAILGIWIDKGMGLIIPGFIPTPIGEVFEYTPTWTEVFVSAGIWAMGFLIITLALKPVIAIELGRLRRHADDRIDSEGHPLPEVDSLPTQAESA